ncbi:MAG: hydrogenase 4 subunit F [Deltaproteobacteria bacterium]|nr:hydrogenase 4 subunit F [Deltaproteobacteria bacterium]
MLAAPLIAGIAGFALKSPMNILRLAALVTGLFFGASVLLTVQVFASPEVLLSADRTLRVDAFSVFHILALALTYFGGSLFALAYFRHEIASGHFGITLARRYGALWLAGLSAMLLVLVSNNLGLMWVGMETTTLVTAYLVAMHGDAPAIEAMWKYLIVCSVGIAFAFMGTLLSAASAPQADGADTLLWTHLMDQRANLNPQLMKAAFVFLIVGYGTKAGLAPMHTWLPDAHSQAPAPVSAMFSGFMLNAALYCVVRYLPIVEATSPGFGHKAMIGFGLFSVLVPAAFIIFQRDAKRMLAYCSVEHLGIIAIGYGLGPLGAFAALFHTLNHSLAKSLAFFSIGRLGQIYGSNDMGRIRGAIGAHPVYGPALLGSVLALIGVAPFAIFASEFQTVRAMVAQTQWWLLALFLLGVSVIFISMLRHVTGMVFGERPDDIEPIEPHPGSKLLSFSFLGALVLLGVWMPPPLRHAIESAAQIVWSQP